MFVELDFFHEKVAQLGPVHVLAALVEGERDWCGSWTRVGKVSHVVEVAIAQKFFHFWSIVGVELKHLTNEAKSVFRASWVL